MTSKDQSHLGSDQTQGADLDQSILMAESPWGSGGGKGGGGNNPWGNGGGNNGGGNRPNRPQRPGGGGGRRPGGPGGPEGPDLEELLREGQDRLRSMFPGGGNGGNGGGTPAAGPLGRISLAFVILVVIGLWMATGIYRVNTGEQGVVLRFGAFVEMTQPGLNYHLPYPIESVETPNVESVNRIDVGFRGGASRDRASSGFGRNENLMLTGDDNIVDINFSVLWKISNAADYLFNLKDPEVVVKTVAESVMREVIGRNEIQPILTERRKQIESEVEALMQEVLNEYGAGIDVTSVQLAKVDPPAQVIDAFRDVQAAHADAERERNKADAYARDVVPRARGDAERIVQQAKGYREQVVRGAEGEASRFLAVYEQYRLAKDVTRKRIFLETMEAVFGDMDKIIIDGDGSGVVPYLPLDRLNKNSQSNQAQ